MDQFFQACAIAARQAGVKFVVIAARNPQTGEALIQASAGAMDDLRPMLASKLGVNLDGAAEDGSETGWPA